METQVEKEEREKIEGLLADVQKAALELDESEVAVQGIRWYGVAGALIFGIICFAIGTILMEAIK